MAEGQDGQIAGKLEIEVEADLSRFGEQLKRGVKKAAAKVEAKVKVTIKQTADELRQDIQEKVDEASEGVTAKVEVEWVTKGLRKRLKEKVREAALGVTAQIGTQVESAVVETQARAAEAQAAADANPVTVPVKPDDKLTGRLLAFIAKAQAEAKAKPIDVPVRVNTKGGGRLGRLLLYPTLASLLQPLIALIGQSVAGLGSLLSAIAPVSGAIGALPSLIFGFVAAMGAGIVATKGLGDAFSALVEMQEKLASGQKLTKEELAAVDKALKNISPSARIAVIEMAGLRDEFKKVRLAVQERFFSKFARDIGPTVKTLLPAFRDGLSKVADQLGYVVKGSMEWGRTPLFKSQLRVLFGQAAGLTRRFGDAAVSLGKAFVNIAIAAGPMIDRIGVAVKHFGDWAASSTSGTKAAGKMRAFFMDAADTAAQLGRIFRDLALGLKGFFSAARESGDSLLDGAEKQAKRFLDYVNSPDGFRKIKMYFDDALPAFRQVIGLIGDISRALVRLSTDGNLSAMISDIRDRFGPAVYQLIDRLGRDLGPTLLHLLGSIAELLSHLSSAVGPIFALVKGLDLLASGLAFVVSHVPGVATLVATFTAMYLAARLTRPIRAGLDGLAAAFGNAGRKAQNFGSIGGAAAGGLGRLSRATKLLSTLAGGPLTIALGVGVAAFDIWASKQREAKQRTEELTQAIREDAGALGAHSAEAVRNTLKQEGVYDAADRLGIKLDVLTDAALGSAGAQNQVNEVLKRAEASYIGVTGPLGNVAGLNQDLVDAAGKVRGALDGTNKTVDEAKKGYDQLVRAGGGAVDATNEQADAAAKAADENQGFADMMDEAGQAADNLRSDLDKLLGIYQSVPQAQADVQEALDQLTDGVNKQAIAYVKHKGQVDLSTDAGRRLQQNIIDLTTKNAALAEATYRTTGSSDKANTAWNKGTEALRKQLEKMGLTKEEAQRLIEKYGAIPDRVATAIYLDARNANGVLSQFTKDFKNIDGSVAYTRIVTTQTRKDGSQSVRTGTASADGGLVPLGLGGPREDNLPYWLSSGEFVINAAATAKFLPLLEAINSGRMQGLADGGLAGSLRGVTSSLSGLLGSLGQRGRDDMERLLRQFLSSAATPITERRVHLNVSSGDQQGLSLADFGDGPGGGPADFLTRLGTAAAASTAEPLNPAAAGVRDINIYPTPEMDVYELARAVRVELDWAGRS